MFTDSTYKRNSSINNIFLCAVDLTPANLFELQALTYDARPKWFNLGLALGINSTKLKTIEIDHREVDPCFREMLSTWLTMSGPQRSWQRLFTALRQPTVGFKDLVESIEDKFGIAVESESSSVGTVGTSAICNTGKFLYNKWSVSRTIGMGKVYHA